MEYPSHLQSYNLVINIIHFCAPFLINILSAVMIIITTACVRTATEDQSIHRTAVYEQMQQHKNLLIAPVVLVLLAIPHLVISL